MNLYKATLFEDIASNACLTLSSFAPQNISNMIWSFATLRVPNSVLFQKVVDEAVGRLETFNTQNLSNLAWGFALQMSDSEINDTLFEALATISMEKMEYFNERYLSNLVWAFVVVDKFPRELFTQVFRKINNVDAAQLDRMSDLDQNQWYQADLALRLQVPALAKVFGLFKPLRKKFGKVLLLSEMNSCTPHKEIAEVLQLFRVPFKNEFKTKSGYCLSFVLLPSERKIAVEYEGPSRFLFQSEKPIGSTVLKRRLMILMGWTVASVSWWEWSEQKTPQQKQSFMIQKLVQCGLQISEIFSNMTISRPLDGMVSPPNRSKGFPFSPPFISVPKIEVVDDRLPDDRTNLSPSQVCASVSMAMGGGAGTGGCSPMSLDGNLSDHPSDHLVADQFGGNQFAGDHLSGGFNQCGDSNGNFAVAVGFQKENLLNSSNQMVRDRALAIGGETRPPQPFRAKFSSFSSCLSDSYDLQTRERRPNSYTLSPPGPSSSSGNSTPFHRFTRSTSVPLSSSVNPPEPRSTPPPNFPDRSGKSAQNFTPSWHGHSFASVYSDTTRSNPSHQITNRMSPVSPVFFEDLESASHIRSGRMSGRGVSGRCSPSAFQTFPPRSLSSSLSPTRARFTQQKVIVPPRKSSAHEFCHPMEQLVVPSQQRSLSFSDLNQLRQKPTSKLTIGLPPPPSKTCVRLTDRRNSSELSVLDLASRNLPESDQFTPDNAKESQQCCGSDGSDTSGTDELVSHFSRLLSPRSHENEAYESVFDSQPPLSPVKRVFQRVVQRAARSFHAKKPLKTDLKKVTDCESVTDEPTPNSISCESSQPSDSDSPQFSPQISSNLQPSLSPGSSTGLCGSKARPAVGVSNMSIETVSGSEATPSLTLSGTQTPPGRPGNQAVSGSRPRTGSGLRAPSSTSMDPSALLAQPSIQTVAPSRVADALNRAEMGLEGSAVAPPGTASRSPSGSPICATTAKNNGWLPNPIIDGLLYRTQSIEGLVFWLSEVIMTKRLSSQFTENQFFGCVELDLSRFVANYRLGGRQSQVVFSHPIQLKGV